MNNELVLEIADLSVLREGQRLIANVRLRVTPGSVHFLVGPNGAGKSTLFHAILGLIDFSGTIRLHWRRSGRLGYVPQFFNVDRTIPLTVAEFLALSRQRRPVCFGVGRQVRAHIDAVLERVGLQGLARRPLGALSGGELQKVLLANAIDPIPELLLLDEPASGLDERAALDLERNLLELRATHGTAVLMVSHDLEHARRIADEVTLIDKEVRDSGPPARVLAGQLDALLRSGAAQVAT